MTTQQMMKRQAQIIAVADEMRYDSIDGQGLHPSMYERDDLFDCIENCTGYKLTDREQRLAVVAFEQDARTAQKCIWSIRRVYGD